jgi:hypothetical protein
VPAFHKSTQLLSSNAVLNSVYVCVCMCVCFLRKLSMNLYQFAHPWYFRVAQSLPYVTNGFPIDSVFLEFSRRSYFLLNSPMDSQSITTLFRLRCLDVIHKTSYIITTDARLWHHSHNHLYHNHEDARCEVTHKPAYIAVLETWVWWRRLNPKGYDSGHIRRSVINKICT